MGTHPIFESDFDCLTDKRLTHLFCSGRKSVRRDEKMSYEPKKEEIQQEEDPNHRIRITISSKNCKAIERISNEIVRSGKVKGPIRQPTKTLRITTRKTPNGEGSKTWDRYQMRIHKRVIDLVSSTEKVRQITQMSIDPGID